jgi:hypothetical protein
VSQCLNRQLKDSIWSVRENGAMALGELLDCQEQEPASSLRIRDITRAAMIQYLQQNLLKAKEEAVHDIKKITFLSPAAFSMLTQSSSSPNQTKSSDNSEDKINPMKASGWGCCLDCVIEKPCRPWEVSDGCVYLLRELVAHSKDDYLSEEEFRLIDEMMSLFELNDFKDAAKLQSTITDQVSSFMNN